MPSRQQRILIFGANGQLGLDLARAITGDFSVVAVNHEECDITDEDRVRQLLADAQPDFVINCAAMTNVPECETRDQRAFEVNARGAKNIAVGCAAISKAMIHVSTDYVFDGLTDQPYVETDLPGPVNVYGLSKLMGEYYIRFLNPKHYIFRSSGLYGIHPSRGQGTNFVQTMLRFAGEKQSVDVVNDEVLTPTHTLDLARQISKVIEHQPPYGIYHATNQGSCSWHRFAEEVFAIAGLEMSVNAIRAADYQSEIRRPAYSVLENQALQSAQLDIMPPWEQALKEHMQEYLQKRPKEETRQG